MATEERDEGERGLFNQDPFVEQMRPEPSEPPSEVVVLEGLAGNSDREGWARLYLNRKLNYCAEFRREDIVFTEDIPPEQSPMAGLKCTRVGIRKDAVIEYTRTTHAKPRDQFDLDVRLAASPQRAAQRIGNTSPNICIEQTFDGCGEPTFFGFTCFTCEEATCNTCQTQCNQYTCNTCNTCQTQCNQNTCYTCNTCQTQCNQYTCNTCNTCQTQCNQNTCYTCQTLCNQQTCNTCRTDCGGCRTDNPRVFTCGPRCGDGGGGFPL